MDGGPTDKQRFRQRMVERVLTQFQAIPRADLGLASGNAPVHIDFKWADNLQRPGDVMDFYLSGDGAPAGRFNYRYDAP